MIIRDINKVTNSALKQELKRQASLGKHFISLYIDSNKECSISYNNSFTEKELKEFFWNIRQENLPCSLDKISIEHDIDYSLDDPCTTTIYTKYGWKY